MSAPRATSPGRQAVALAFLTLPWFPSTVIAVETPNLMLAQSFQETGRLSDFWVSEKLDGIRAYWDGAALITRNGNQIHAPQWFTQALPNIPLDGELWLGRGKFERLLSTVSKDHPIDSEWQQVKYMVFDLPAHLGTFDDRQLELQERLTALKNKNIKAVKQYKVSTRKALDDELTLITAKGGEGLMLHRGSSLYQAYRSNDLQKLKLVQDAEAKVIDYFPGKGKYSEMMGALLVETQSGIQFRIGSGFSDSERRHPPAIGSIITYQYRGKTRKGIPRFATYMRMKEVI